MSINLKKNEATILDAWRKVTENEDAYDWALFGYEGKSFDLKVEAIGCGGIEGIAEEFNDGKIQYGYVRVLDPNTKLVKFLLINFQGESVIDLVHKGTCSNHIRDVSKMLKNQLTITASSTDDLDEEVILKKLSKITSAYNFESRAAPSDEKFVIGTNYSKVVPKREIDVNKRDEFWRKEEEIEKARVAAELEAKRLENLKIEEERLKREQREHLKREQLNKEIEAKKTIPEPRAEIKTISPIKNVVAVEKDESPSTKPRAEELRMERRKEAQELIGNKVNAAKMMFQQQAAQSVQPPAKVAPPAKPIRKTIHKNEPEQPPQVVQAPPEPIRLPEPEPEIQEIIQPAVEECTEIADDEQFSTIKRSPKTPTTPENNNNNGFIINDNGTETNNYTQNDNVQVNVVAKEEKQEEKEIQSHVDVQQPEEQQPESLDDDQHLLKAVALYDYQAADDTEISFDPGDLITHIDCIDAGWWQGYSVRFGTYGLFPANYVQVIDDAQMPQ